jgi:hypothetical protein
MHNSWGVAVGLHWGEAGDKGHTMPYMQYRVTCASGRLTYKLYHMSNGIQISLAVPGLLACMVGPALLPEGLATL